MNAPPPPPPHGEMPRSTSSGLPPGKYDIFVIPEHSAGSGFLYLPSLKPNINSFVAGFASALILVVLFQSITPAFRVWWESFHGLGNMAMLMLLVGVGFGAWALGRTQNDAGNDGPKFNKRDPPNANGSAGQTGQGGFENGHSRGTSNSSAPPPHSSPPPPPPPNGGGPGPSTWDSGSPPNNQYQSHAPPPPKPKPAPQPKSPRPDAKGSWEKARDEMRKKEEERKAKAAEQKRREEISKRLAELRAKEAKERLQREKDKEKKEKEIKEAAEKKAAAAAAAAAATPSTTTTTTTTTPTPTPSAPPPRAQSSYAFSGVGEKMNMWPNGKPPTPPTHTNTTPKSPASPTKRPPAPTARTYLSTDEDSYSYRPYDKPRQPQRKKSNGSLASDVSWANSHTTARTSPPPSVRGPYTTKDPDKIVIQAVYMFMNQFAKTPASQLISGVGSVTDGLILRITTEGLFIDDDVRGVPQREWDVKGWTLKLVEVWCPPHCLNSASASTPASKSPGPNLLFKMAAARSRDRDGAKPVVGEDADAFLTDMVRACKECCRLGLCDSKFSKANIPSSTGQTGEWKTKGLHLLRATVKDQDGKRYLFVIDETEYWKVGASIQRLRRGTQARQLGVSAMTATEARTTLETLGWTD